MKYIKKENLVGPTSYSVASEFTTPRSEIPNRANCSVNLPIPSERYKETTKNIESHEAYYDNLNTSTTTDKICNFEIFEHFD